MLEHKVVLITGGGSGIGLAAVELFAEYGAQLAVVDRNENTAQEAAERARSLGADAIAVIADVSNEAQVEHMVATAVEHFGRLDGAFNNAGVETLNLPLHEISLEGFRKVMAVDLDGVFLCMKHEISAMLKLGIQGSIVNTASTLSMVAMRNGSEYVAAKHGVLGLSRSAAVDYAESGIRVNALLPGVIATPIMTRLSQDPAVSAMLGKMRDAHPLGRFGTPSEMAEAAAWLLSDKASFVTGTGLSADGGFQAL